MVKMLLYICIAFDIWCLLLLLFRGYWECLSTIPWSILTVGTFTCILLTFIVHAYSWRCWDYLRYKPRRLRSMSQDSPPIRKSWWLFTVGWVLALCGVSFSLWTSLHDCGVSWWYGLLCFAFIIVIYTALNTSLSSSSSESSNVNAAVGNPVCNSVGNPVGNPMGNPVGNSVGSVKLSAVSSSSESV